MTFQFPSQHHTYNWSPGPGASFGAKHPTNGRESSRRSGELDRDTARQTLSFLAAHDISHARKADQIQPGLYLGDLNSARDKKWLEEKRISHVFSICHCPDLQLEPDIKHKVIDVKDARGEDLLDHFKNAWRFISNTMDEGGRLLIHCEQGISRSATVLAAYLMKAERLHSIEALRHIRKFRPIIEPNEGFREQLHIWGQCRGELEGKVEYITWKQNRARAQLRT